MKKKYLSKEYLNQLKILELHINNLELKDYLIKKQLENLKDNYIILLKEIKKKYKIDLNKDIQYNDETGELLY